MPVSRSELLEAQRTDDFCLTVMTRQHMLKDVVSEGESESVVQTWDTVFVARVSVATHCAPPKGEKKGKGKEKGKKGQRTKKKKG